MSGRVNLFFRFRNLCLLMEIWKGSFCGEKNRNYKTWKFRSDPIFVSNFFSAFISCSLWCICKNSHGAAQSIREMKREFSFLFFFFYLRYSRIFIINNFTTGIEYEWKCSRIACVFLFQVDRKCFYDNAKILFTAPCYKVCQNGRHAHKNSLNL